MLKFTWYNGWELVGLCSWGFLCSLSQESAMQCISKISVNDDLKSSQKNQKLFVA